MANLPTAYASQNFGRKTLDFYAAAGEVSGSDPRARADEHSLTDFDGAKHTVRVMDRDFALEAGDQASVLRMQTGPSRRSRPVAVVNHTRQGWSRTHPGASAMLSRAGVARNVNWFLTVLLFALAAMVMVWPYLRTFLVEVDPSLFSAAPSFNIFTLALSALPDLGNWSFSQTVSPLSTLIASAAPSLAEQVDQIVFYALSGLAALVVFATRSWRLLWAPLFVGLVAAAALGLGGAEGAPGYAVAAYGLSAVIFVIGGLINRIRDAARLERRIALLADHLQRHAPEETIARTDDADLEADDAEAEASDDDASAMAAVVAPVSAALSETGEDAADAAQAELPEAENCDAEIIAEADPQPEAQLDAPAEDEDNASNADAETVEDAVQAEDEPVEALAEPDHSDADAISEDDAVAEVSVEDDALPASDAAEDEIEADAMTSDEDAAEPVLADGEVSEDEPALAAPVADDADAVTNDGSGVVEEADDFGDEAVETSLSVTDAEEASDEAELPEAELEAEAETDAGSEPLTSESEVLPEPALTNETPDADPVVDAPEGEVELAGLDAEEAERLKNDPRYAARAIVLPSPPPMPSAEESVSDGVEPAHPTTRETRELRPSEPLTNRVLSLFSNPVVPPAPPAPPAPSPSTEDEDA